MEHPYRTHAHLSEDGTLVLSNLPFAAGEQVEVTLRAEPFVEEQPALQTDALAVLEKLIGTVEAPSDGAAEHDHYLYGTPKRADQGAVTRERIFLDTWFILALLNARDADHAEARRLLPRIRSAATLVTTDAILLEACNGLTSTIGLGLPNSRTCYTDATFDVVPIDRRLMSSALRQYEGVSDKDWGLTDCLSFVVMREHEIQLAATRDHHFRQAGFITLVL